jgi:hypothetical protein
MENCIFMGGLEIQTFPNAVQKPGWRSENSFAERAVQDVTPCDREIIEAGRNGAREPADMMIRANHAVQWTV